MHVLQNSCFANRDLKDKKKYDVGKTAEINNGFETTAITSDTEQEQVMIFCQYPELYVKGYCTVQIRLFALKSSVVVNQLVPKMNRR